jgi:hypothetical protein
MLWDLLQQIQLVRLQSHSGSLEDRVLALEGDVQLLQRLLQPLVELLQEQFGEAEVGARLRAAVAAEQEGAEEGRRVVAQLDALVARGEFPRAASLLQQGTGLTWEQAQAMVDRWHAEPPARKEGLVRAMRRSRGGAAPAGDEAPPGRSTA